MSPCRLAPLLDKPVVRSGRHSPAAPRRHCAAPPPVAAPHPSLRSTPYLPPPPRPSAKTASPPTAAWGRARQRHWHCRRLAVAAADGGGAAEEARRAHPRSAAAAHAAGRRTAAGAARPTAVTRGRRPPAAPHPPQLPAKVVAHFVGGADAAADSRRSDGRASSSEVAGARSPTASAPRPAWTGETAGGPKMTHTCLERRQIYRLELTVAAGVDPQHVHRWRGGACVLGGKGGVYSMV